MLVPFDYVLLTLSSEYALFLFFLSSSFLSSARARRFNRIPIEVLSVVSNQVMTILQALRSKQTRFDFMGDNIRIISTVGAFITMNPGYAGRTELPESLKALFRPCAMVVPDFEMICENMLLSEGFLSARPLAKKIVTLYRLGADLLSKQAQYDWGLRAIKSVLRVAGGLKRAERQVRMPMSV